MKRLLLALSAPVLALLKHPRLVIEIGVVFAIALIWFAGPWVGFDSVEGRVQVIIGIVLLRAVAHVAQYLLAERRAAKLEESLQQQGVRQAGGARPDRQEEIDAVRVQFEKGIAALKESKLSKGLRGKAALYALPLSLIGLGTSVYHYLGQKVPGFLPLGSCRGGVPCSMQYIDWLGAVPGWQCRNRPARRPVLGFVQAHRRGRPGFRLGSRDLGDADP